MLSQKLSIYNIKTVYGNFNMFKYKLHNIKDNFMISFHNDLISKCVYFLILLYTASVLHLGSKSIL